MGLGRSIRVLILLVVPSLSLAALAIAGRFNAMAALGVFLGVWAGAGLVALFKGRPAPEPVPEAPVAETTYQEVAATTAVPEKDAFSPAMQEEMRELEHIAAEVQDGATAVKETFGDVMRLTGNVNRDLEKIAGGVKKQAKQYQDIGQLAERMAEATSTVSTKTEAMAASAGQTLSSARSGAAAVTKTIDEMKNIRNTVVDNAEKIRQLGDRSARIGQIVTVIGELADQTNLLALNAAIEAARAGEQGRGFAVVASEVRRLAERSNTAAKDIEELVADIIAQTKEAIGAMQKGTEQVETGVVLADEAGRALGEIEKVVEQSASEIRYISENAVQNAQTIEELVRSIEDVAAITDENSETIRQMAEADWFSSAIRRFEDLADETQRKSALVRKKAAALLEITQG